MLYFQQNFVARCSQDSFQDAADGLQILVYLYFKTLVRDLIIVLGSLRLNVLTGAIKHPLSSLVILAAVFLVEVGYPLHQVNQIVNRENSVVLYRILAVNGFHK